MAHNGPPKRVFSACRYAITEKGHQKAEIPNRRCWSNGCVADCRLAFVDEVDSASRAKSLEPDFWFSFQSGFDFFHASMMEIL